MRLNSVARVGHPKTIRSCQLEVRTSEGGKHSWGISLPLRFLPFGLDTGFGEGGDW